MAVMAREAWTDERLDDLKEHMDDGFKEVKSEMRELNRRFDRLNFTLITGLIGLIASHYLG